MRSKETESVELVNTLIKNGWRIHEIKKDGGKVIFLLIKD